MAKFNFTPVQQVFADADDSSVSFAERLLTLGIATKSEAKPHAMSYASIRYTAKITKGRQGNVLPRNSDAERAMYRVLALCFPSADKPVSSGKQKRVVKKTDVVAQLVTKYGKLTKAEQRRFLSSI
jgi:hypothetical protein